MQEQLHDLTPPRNTIEHLRTFVESGHLRALTRAETQVLISLFIHADREGIAFPSVNRIASQWGLGRRAVQIALGSLRQRQLIRRVKPAADSPTKSHLGSARMYRIARASTSEGARTCAAHSAPECAPGAHVRAQRKTNERAQGGARPCASGAHQRAPKSLRERPIERQQQQPPMQMQPTNISNSAEEPDERRQTEDSPRSAIIESLTTLGFADERAAELEGEFGEHACRCAIALCNSRSNVKEPTAFVIQALRRGYWTNGEPILKRDREAKRNAKPKFEVPTSVDEITETLRTLEAPEEIIARVTASEIAIEYLTTNPRRAKAFWWALRLRLMQKYDWVQSILIRDAAERKDAQERLLAGASVNLYENATIVSPLWEA